MSELVDTAYSPRFREEEHSATAERTTKSDTPRESAQTASAKLPPLKAGMWYNTAT